MGATGANPLSRGSGAERNGRAHAGGGGAGAHARAAGFPRADLPARARFPGDRQGYPAIKRFSLPMRQYTISARENQSRIFFAKNHHGGLTNTPRGYTLYPRGVYRVSLPPSPRIPQARARSCERGARPRGRAISPNRAFPPARTGAHKYPREKRKKVFWRFSPPPPADTPRNPKRTAARKHLRGTTVRAKHAPPAR